jgi:hypothetical protein
MNKKECCTFECAGVICGRSLRAFCLSLAVALGVFIAIIARSDSVNFYVSPLGDDDANGSLSEPFRTLSAARDAVRSVASGMQTDIYVYVDSGDYFLEDTLVLGPEDSARAGHRIIYYSAGGAGKARVVGGKKVEEWTQYDDTIWVAQVDSIYPFHSLYENGQRAWKARTPNRQIESRFPVVLAPYLLTDTGPGLSIKASDLSLLDLDQWDLSGAEIVISPRGNKDWELLTLPLVGVDSVERLLKIKELSRSNPAFEDAPMVTNLAGGMEIEVNSRYFIQGIFELLDQPGEFHYDHANGLLYFWPRDGNPNNSEILVPRMQTLLAISGDPDGQKVRNIRFEGFRFEGADFTDYYAGPFSFEGYRTGMVTVTDARNIHFRNCHFLNAGFPALMIVDDNAGHMVEGSLFENAGGGIWAVTTPQRNSSANRDHRFINNLIMRMGEFSHSPGVGIKIQQSSGVEIAHCHVRDVTRWGFSIRGRASNRDDNIGARGANIVRHSIVERAVQDSGDAGALHTANVSVNVEPYNENFFRQIIVRDTRSHSSVVDPWSGNGLFTDFESFGQVFEDILIVGTEGADPYRANPIQGPNPPGLTPNHQFHNVSWEEGFDEQRMEFDQIGLLPGFPHNYLAAMARSGFFEDFNHYEEGPLVGQSGWQLDNESGPSVVAWQQGNGVNQLAGPAPEGSPGVIAVHRIVEGGIPLSANLPVHLEFEIIQMTAGNIPSVGMGGGARVPASVGIIQGHLIVRGEGFGSQFQAYRADGTLYPVELGQRYRLRSLWRPFDNASTGSLSLTVSRVDGRGFEQLYFLNGEGELQSTVGLELTSNPANWDRVWMRLGAGGQRTFIDNIRLQIAPPAPAVNFFANWQIQWFDEQAMLDPALTSAHASASGDGVANLIKAAMGVDPFASLHPSLLPRVDASDPNPRFEFTLAEAATGLNILAETSIDLLNWQPLATTHRLAKVHTIDGRNHYTFENLNENKQKEFFRIRVSMEDFNEK